jgi:hypothetical protein
MLKEVFGKGCVDYPHTKENMFQDACRDIGNDTMMTSMLRRRSGMTDGRCTASWKRASTRRRTRQDRRDELGYKAA